MTLKRTMCALLAATMILPTAIMAETSAAAAEIEVEESSAQVTLEESGAGSYGLADNIQDGVIFHAFCWKYNDITAMLPDIAKAGFTSVQTSPPQATDGTGSWWWFYQPKGFYIGTSAMGTKQDLANLCSEADKYGIKIIADVVANHLAGNHDNIQDDLKDSQYWHPDIGDAKDGNRYSVTHGKIGMPDLNTEHSYVQQCVYNYVQELKGVGVDGIRFDAAKHIGLPSEGDQFWPNVTKDSSLWYYGEILNNPGLSFDENSGQRQQAISVMKEYTNYMTVTDSPYGMTLRDSFNSGTAPSSFGNYCAEWMGLPNSKLLYWGESHDTWSNNDDWGYSNTMSQNVIDRAYAMAASRNEVTALYFSRPSTAVKDDITIGEKGSTHFTAAEVAAVNKFHNAMIGKADYFVNSNGCAVVTRKGGGAVIAKGSGSGYVSVTNGGGYAKTGTYKDAVSGNEFTVTATTISGTIGSSGIAVIYDEVDNGSVSATPATGTTFTDTITVTLNSSNVSSASYKTSEGGSGEYTNGKTITIGSSTAQGSNLTLTLTGKKSDGSTVTATYTYKKTAPKEYPTLDGAGFVFDNSEKNWSTVNAYVYDESGSSVVTNGAWPGVKMTDCGNGYWKYNLDSKFASSSNVQVIFNNGSEQIPAAQQPGYKMSGTDKKLYESSTWKDLPVSNLKVTLDSSVSSVTVGEPVTLTATATGASGTVNYTFSDGSNTIQSSTKNTAAWTPVAAGTYTITVTAKDSSGSATAAKTLTVAATKEPMVNVDKASGTSFNSETMSLKLTLANATSGTYSVDDGPVKTFTGSKTITIGEGKIGDSTVTVKTTATSGSTTKTYTYTYEKKYQKKTSSSSGTNASAAAVTEETSGAALASQYKTNAKGVGKEKTITIDGDASDWSEDMLIAQGAAWDVANHWKGGHENCVLDTYALFGAWDNDNLYIGWQMVNTTDTWAREGDGPLSDGGRVLDVPLILALSIDPTSTSMSNKNTDSNPIWGQKMGLEFDTHVDGLLYMSGKPGLGEPSMFKAVDSNGNTNYTTGCVAFGDGGIEYKMATTNICSSIIGLNNSDDPSDVTKDSADWVDYKTFSGSAGTHKTTYDSFYEIKIPFKTLGITKDYITNYGIGAMLVATRGESALDCIPYDYSMVDNAKEDYGSDASTSHEKDDVDVITSSLARVGNGKIVPPDSDTDTEDTLPLQVNFGTDKSAPQYTSTSLTLKGIGYGGTAPYKYQFSVDGTVVKASNTTSTYTWKPGTEGSHTIKCVITDSTGKTATVSKTFTAESKDSDSDVSDLKNNSTVSASKVNVGTTVTITGKATGGTGFYQYAFYYKRGNATSWTTKAAYGSATSVTLTPAYADTYTIRVDVKDSNGAVVSKTLTVTSEKVETLKNNSTVSATAVNVGDTVTITGKASGGTSPYQYAFYYKRGNATSWTTKAAYGKATSVTLTPAYADTYTVRVDAKDSAGTVISKTFTITSTVPKALSNDSTISKTTAKIGDTITITGAASGGKGSYKYAYYYKRSSMSTWMTKGTEYGTTTSVTLTPAYKETYQVMVNVMDSEGTIKSKTFTVTVGDVTTLVNNSTVSATAVKVGTTITITGKASGGTSPYQYAFYYKRGNATSWTTKAAYGKATSVELTPAYVDTYTVRVDVKDNNGTVATKTYTITSSDTTPLTNNSTVSSTAVQIGKTVTITGKAAGGSGSYQYAFYYKRSGAASWTTKSAYGKATSVELSPAYSDTYTIRVDVKDSKGTVVSKTFTVVTALTNKSTVSTTSVKVGNTVKITGAATGGKGTYQYAFYYKKGSATSWTTKSAYGKAAAVDLTPVTATTYTVRVDVKDSNGTVSSKTFTVTAKN